MYLTTTNGKTVIRDRLEMFEIMIVSFSIKVKNKTEKIFFFYYRDLPIKWKVPIDTILKKKILDER